MALPAPRFLQSLQLVTKDNFRYTECEFTTETLDPVPDVENQLVLTVDAACHFKIKDLLTSRKGFDCNRHTDYYQAGSKVHLPVTK